jgi:hypothetical protein
MNDPLLVGMRSRAMREASEIGNGLGNTILGANLVVDKPVAVAAHVGEGGGRESAVLSVGELAECGLDAGLKKKVVLNVAQNGKL